MMRNGASAHFNVINSAVALCFKKVGHPGRTGCQAWRKNNLEKLCHSNSSALQKAKKTRPEYSECNWEHNRTLRHDFKTKILEV